MSWFQTGCNHSLSSWFIRSSVGHRDVCVELHLLELHSLNSLKGNQTFPFKIQPEHLSGCEGRQVISPPRQSVTLLLVFLQGIVVSRKTW